MTNPVTANSLKPGLPVRLAAVFLTSFLGLFAGMVLGSLFVEREGMAGSAGLLLYGLVGRIVPTAGGGEAAGEDPGP